MTVAVFVDCSGIGRGNEGNLSQKCKGLGTLAAAQSTKLSPPSFEYSHRLQNSSFAEIGLELELLERFPCKDNEIKSISKLVLQPSFRAVGQTHAKW